MGTGKKEFSGNGAVSKRNGPGDRSRNLFAARGLLAALVLCFAITGCIHVPARQQRLVSKPNMGFSDSLVFGYQNRLLPQVEPGSAFSGGAQSSGCTSCK